MLTLKVIKQQTNILNRLKWRGPRVQSRGTAVICQTLQIGDKEEYFNVDLFTSKHDYKIQ